MPLKGNSSHAKSQTGLWGGSLQHTRSAQLAHLTPHHMHPSHPVIGSMSPGLTLAQTESSLLIFTHPCFPGSSPASLRSNVSLHKLFLTYYLYLPSPWTFPQPICWTLHTHTRITSLLIVIMFSHQIWILTLVTCLLTKLQAPHHTPSLTALWPAIPDHKANESPRRTYGRMKFFWFYK